MARQDNMRTTGAGTTGAGRTAGATAASDVVVPVQAKTSAAAAFALVFGLSALITALLVVLSPVAVVFGLIAVVLGVVGIGRARANQVTGQQVVTGRGLAIGG